MIGDVDLVTPDTVDAVLRSGRFTTYQCGPGVLVLDYPHMLNGFVDEFYVAVLESAGD